MVSDADQRSADLRSQKIYIPLCGYPEGMCGFFRDFDGARGQDDLLSVLKVASYAQGGAPTVVAPGLQLGGQLKKDLTWSVGAHR